jgi:hypothetical protein
MLKVVSQVWSVGTQRFLNEIAGNLTTFSTDAEVIFYATYAFYGIGTNSFKYSRS